MFKIMYFVPLESAEKVKQALFKVGASHIGNYKECCFVTKGVGQFRPIQGANPTIGQIDEVEYVDEYKVEMVCSDELIGSVINTLKESHPYEEPGYEVYKLCDY